MPGAYSHIAAAKQMTSGNRLDSLPLNRSIKKALSVFPEYCILGAVSPDYPYLNLGHAESAQWADAMHHTQVDAFIRYGAELLHKMPAGDNKDKCLAWFLGFVAHIGMDMTIHPIVETIAGIYSASKDNQKRHRVCEMHQDVYIWRTLDIGEIGRGEVIDNIRLCGEQDNLDPAVKNLWDQILKAVHKNMYQQHAPLIATWHQKFPFVVDGVEESHEWPAFARHVLAGKGLSYPILQDVEPQYIANLSAPDGNLYRYDDIFTKALGHVGELWTAVAATIIDGKQQHLHMLGDWDLDRGLTSAGEYVFWSQPNNSATQQSA